MAPPFTGPFHRPHEHRVVALDAAAEENVTSTDPGGHHGSTFAHVTSAVPDSFTLAELRGLDEPVQRYFRSAISLGAPLVTGVRLTMRGHIKLGRWVPFRATEVLAPRSGFLWRASAAGIIGGTDRYLAGQGEMRWRLAGTVPLLTAGGPDVSRSAAGRTGAEGLWVPTALLPRFGVEWRAESDTDIVGRFDLDGVPIELRHQLTDTGALTATSLRRWGDPSGGTAFDWHPFGGPVHATRTWSGFTVPSEGSVGWHPGTERWADGEFFRYRLTGLQPIARR